MDDDKLKCLFSDFHPELSSDIMFMNKLDKHLESVEMIKRHASEVRSRYKKALLIAAAGGFVFGFLFSMLLPYLSDTISGWKLNLPSDSIMHSLVNNYMLIAWLVIGCTSALVSLNIYEISISLLSRRSRNI